MVTPARVQRMNPAGPLHPVQWLCRDESLFCSAEWTWQTSRAAAFCFADYESPACKGGAACSTHAACAASAHGGFPVIASAEKAEPTPQPPRGRDARDPGAVFADLERRRLA